MSLYNVVSCLACLFGFKFPLYVVVVVDQSMSACKQRKKTKQSMRHFILSQQLKFPFIFVMS